MRIDRTGITYEHLIAIHDTGERTKKGERVWAARCTVVRGGKECGRVIKTHHCSQVVRVFGRAYEGCYGRSLCGLEAVRRTDRQSAHRDYWLLECPTCHSQITPNIVVGRHKLFPCRTCRPAPPRRRPPQKVTTKDYPVLRRQLALLWLRLKDRLDAGEVVEILVGGRYSGVR